MAIFGKNTAGATPQACDANFKFGSKFTIPEIGRVSKLTAYVDGNGGGAGSQAMRGGIYTDSSGVPSSLVAQTDPISVAAGQAANWVDLLFADAVLLLSAPYWLVLHAGTTTLVARSFYDAVAAAEEWTADTYSDGLAASWGTNEVNENKERSIYATYATVIAAPLPPPRLDHLLVR